MKRVVVAVVLLLSAHVLSAAVTLRVVSAGSAGGVASMAAVPVLRVMFFAPMLVVCQMPEALTDPFSNSAPSLRRAFRWSGTASLLFTPPGLPFAPQFTVALERTVRSVAGNTL